MHPKQVDLPANIQNQAMEYRILFGLTTLLMLLATLYSRHMRDMKEISSPRLLLHLRLRTQRRFTLGLAGVALRLRRNRNRKTY